MMMHGKKLNTRSGTLTGFIRMILLGPILLGLMLLHSAEGRADVSLNFGVYTSDKPTEMVKKFRPVLNALEAGLSERLGEPVSIRIQVASNYERGVQDLVSGRVDFARFGPASYIVAKEQNPEVTILAVENNKGSKVFNGVICVHAESPIHHVEELKGKRFAFGNERSTIGRYLSQNYLYQHGVGAKELAAYEYLGRHDKVGAAVAAGQFEAGALKEGTFKKLVSKGTPIRAIASFPNVTKPWIARSDLPQREFNALQDVLLALQDPAALKALKKDGFLPGNDADYAVIRSAIQGNPIFFE